MSSQRSTPFTRHVLPAVLVAIFAIGVAPAAELLLVRHSISDNGDDDGFADPNETLQLRILLRNEGDTTVDGIEALLRSSDATRACITQSSVSVGSLAPGEERWTTGNFTVQVGDVQRDGICSVGGGTCETDADCPAGPGDTCDAVHVELNARLQLYLSIDSTLQSQVRQIVLPLDLDVSGGSAPAAFVEGFESGDLGAFAPNNMDGGLHGLALGDGTRCQYNDPDWPNSTTYGSSEAADCYPGPSLTTAEQFYWQVDDINAPDGEGRSYTGQYSLYMGEILTPFFGRTTPLATLEAVELDQPLTLARGRECFGSWATCATDGDCPVGEPCVGLAPTLGITHQIRLIGWREIAGMVYRQTLDRAVLQIQPADDAGDPTGPWTTIAPYFNPYDETASLTFRNCRFDPTDDGTTEDDFFDPLDPARRFGPSSSCYPGRSFAAMGETFEPFDVSAVGQAPHGVGLPGASGDGTWIESRFDLSRWAGRRVRVRFLTTALKVGANETWDQILAGEIEFNPDPADDGWWIDDVTIDHTSPVPYSVVSDTTDNSGLPIGDADGDSDGVFDVCDGCPAVADADQADADLDGIGDACDACPLEFVDDADGDGLCCPLDNCCLVANAGQQDADGDGAGDACDGNSVITVAGSGADFPDLQLAIDAVTESGTTIVVQDGNYGGPVVIDRGMALTIIGEGDATLTGTLIVVSTFGDRPIRIRGLAMHGLVASAPTIVESCRIGTSNVDVAIELLAATHRLTDIEPFSSAAPVNRIVVHNGASLTLDRATLTAPSGSTLRVAGTATVTNAEITGETGVTVESTGLLDLRHSTLADGSVAGLVVEPGGSASVEYSILWGSVTDVVGLSCNDIVRSDVGTPSCAGINGSFQVAPTFVAAGDYHLSFTSQLIDRIPSSVFLPGSPCLDRDGKPRRLDGRGLGQVRLDLGAYEFGDGPGAADEILTLTAGDATTFVWDALPGTPAYHVYRDALSAVGPGDYATCRNDLDANRSNTVLTDGELPAPGSGFAYLVSTDPASPPDGTIGYATCSERSIGIRCP